MSPGTKSGLKGRSAAVIDLDEDGLEAIPHEPSVAELERQLARGRSLYSHSLAGAERQTELSVAVPPESDGARVEAVLQQEDPPTLAHAFDETKRRTETGFSRNRET